MESQKDTDFKVIVDANVIIACLIKKGKIFNVLRLTKDYINFLSPDFLIDEIYEKLDYISKKSGLSKNELEFIFSEILKWIKIIRKEKYEDKLKEAKKICKDIKDVPYVALALKFDCGIWTYDKKLKEDLEKVGIKVYTSDEILDILSILLLKHDKRKRLRQK